MTNMHYSSYNNSRWKIYSSKEYEVWFGTLDSESKEAVLERVLLLEAFGPNLPRPYADVLKGSEMHKNLKELRAKTMNHILRVAYYFDRKRNAILLTGGDKKGKNEERFYKNLIAEADRIIEKHEQEMNR